ncbi:MAG: hypothetical protein GY777_10040 [Candidatus Brocadiaceae bacterium]|nr:hypothetical protein [Candidatus Brocadiaceae bacterium]
MNNNEFESESKLNKTVVQGCKQTGAFRIIASSCCLALILSACASTTTTSSKTIKAPTKKVSKHNLVVTSETKRTSEEIKDARQKNVFPALDINNMNEAINYCGKTRMLSMRMANLYGVQVLQGYPVEKKQKAKEQLEYAMINTNEIYDALLAFTPIKDNQDFKQKVESSRDNWFQLKKILSEKPTEKEFLDVLDKSDTLLRNSDTMTRYLEVQATDNKSKLINIAGRQRMYSMKLARDYLAASMDIDKEHRMNMMLETINIFDSAMLALEGAPNNTSEIKGLIKSITKMEWRKVYQTVNQCIKENGKTFNLLVMINFCETLLEKADRLTVLYAEAG